MHAVVAKALRSLERSMARNPRDLIVETILEGYRQEQRILTGDRPDDVDADMFGELFARAQADGKLGRATSTCPTCRGWRRCMSARAYGTGRSAASASGPSPMWWPATSPH